MRSRPRAAIEPIHIHELLNGAGMRGFLSVLDSPVPAPHLRELGKRGDHGATEPGEASLSRLSARADALLGQIGRQEQLLRLICEMAHRINGGAVSLQRQADAVRTRHVARFSTQKGRKTQ